MFLANSLKEKLKRDFMEGDSESTGPTYKFESKPLNPKVLMSFKEIAKSSPDIKLSSLWNIDTQQLHSMDKKDWEKSFSVSKLHERWKEKGIIDFDDKFKKFPDNSAFPGVKEKKEYVYSLKDPDILHLKQKRWNISTLTTEKFVPELSKKLFEAKHGLNEFMVVPLKPHVVPEGVDSRNFVEIDGNTWNISNLPSQLEIKKINSEKDLSAKENTIKYWKKNEFDRINEKPLPISNERKKIEVIRYFKRYRTPIQKSIDFQNTMNKVREATIFEKENVEKKVIRNNPGMERYPEKINALVFKEMFTTYKDKYNELIGNLSKEELKRRQMQKNRFKWNDVDLVNKITAIKKLTGTGIFDEIQITEETNKAENNKLNDDYLSEGKTSKAPSTKGTMRRSMSTCKGRYNILLPLVIKGTDINREEDKIAEKLEEEYKKEQKKEMLLILKGYKKKVMKDKFESKFPISKKEYLISQKLKEESKGLMKTGELSNYKFDNSNLFSTNLSSDNIETLNKISKSANCNPHFLEAYNKIAGKEFQRLNEWSKNIKENIDFEYSHPGVYRSFTFIEKVSEIKTDITGEEVIHFIPKKITESLWSCCMNSDKNSKGCQTIGHRKYKWIYN